MSEQDTTVESAATPEVQAEAEKMGWIPPARFKGAADRFIDAEAYLERGETVLPIVKAQLATTRADLARQNVINAESARVIKTLQDSVAAMEERHTVATQKAVERARDEVKAQLAAASEAGDHAAVAQLTEELVDASAAVADAKTPVKPAATTVQAAEQPLDPEFVAWQVENTWFGQNKRKTALALGIADDLRASGEPLRGRAFYDKVAAEMEKELAPAATAATSKVASGRNGSDADSRSPGGKKGFAAMPADARKACDDQTRDFVGPGKRYKDQAAWREAYATIYHEMP